MEDSFHEVRQRTHALLQQRGIPSHPYLPLLDAEAIRPAGEVADKIVALYCLAGLANEADGGLLLEWLAEEDSLAVLDAGELKLLEEPELPEDLLNELSWKQEALYALCWAAGIGEEMPWPDSEVDLSEVFPGIPPEVPIESFRTSLALRERWALIEALDLYYNLHASLSHSELWGGRDPERVLSTEVVVERRPALEWLCSGKLDWDEVSLDT